MCVYCSRIYKYIKLSVVYGLCFIKYCMLAYRHKEARHGRYYGSLAKSRKLCHRRYSYIFRNTRQGIISRDGSLSEYRIRRGTDLSLSGVCDYCTSSQKNLFTVWGCSIFTVKVISALKGGFIRYLTAPTHRISKTAIKI